MRPRPMPLDEAHRVGRRAIDRDPTSDEAYAFATLMDRVMALETAIERMPDVLDEDHVHAWQPVRLHDNVFPGPVVVAVCLEHGCLTHTRFTLDRTTDARE